MGKWAVLPRWFFHSWSFHITAWCKYSHKGRALFSILLKRVEPAKYKHQVGGFISGLYPRPFWPDKIRSRKTPYGIKWTEDINTLGEVPDEAWVKSFLVVYVQNLEARSLANQVSIQLVLLIHCKKKFVGHILIASVAFLLCVWHVKCKVCLRFEKCSFKVCCFFDLTHLPWVSSLVAWFVVELPGM